MSFNRAQLVIFGAIGVIMLITILVIFGVIPGLRPPSPAKFTISVWGFEDEELWSLIGEKYHEELRHVTVEYDKKDPANYERELLNALAAGSGPDIFVLNNTQIEEHKDKLLPLPEEELSFRARDYKSAFFDAAAADLITNKGEILGLPLALDTLALYYNRDYFNSANISSPPQTWEGLIDAVKRLTTYSEVGTVLRSGIALGTSANVEHAVDIVSALMMQSGVELIDRAERKSKLVSGTTPSGTQEPAEAALSFYVSFADSAKRTYTWSGFFPNSLDAFTQGKTAMMMGYASDIPLIVEKNPHLSFDVSPFPQPENSSIKAYFARYNFEAVSKRSPRGTDGWRFLLWLANKENDKIFSEALKLAPARRDLAGEKAPAEHLDIFYSQVLSAKTWLVPDEEKISVMLTEMIDSAVNKTATPGAAVGRAHTRLDNLLKPPQ